MVRAMRRFVRRKGTRCASFDCQLLLVAVAAGLGVVVSWATRGFSAGLRVIVGYLKFGWRWQEWSWVVSVDARLLERVVAACARVRVLMFLCCRRERLIYVSTHLKRSCNSDHKKPNCMQWFSLIFGV